MSGLQKQKDVKIELTSEQTNPYLAKAEDFKIGNPLSESDPNHKEALRDSEKVRPA